MRSKKQYDPELEVRQNTLIKVDWKKGNVFMQLNIIIKHRQSTELPQCHSDLKTKVKNSFCYDGDRSNYICCKELIEHVTFWCKCV